MKRCHSSDEEDTDEVDYPDEDDLYTDDLACMADGDSDIPEDMEGDPFTSDEDLFPERYVDANKLMSYPGVLCQLPCIRSSECKTSGPSVPTRVKKPSLDS